MNKLALTLAAALIAPAWGADFLEPEPLTYLPLTGLNAALKESLDPIVTVRMIVEPTQQISYAVLLEQKQDRNFIVSLKFTPEVEYILQRYDEIERFKQDPPSDDPIVTADQLAELEKDLPPYPKDAMPERCEVEIDRTFAIKLVETWKAMLNNVRPHPFAGRMHGTFYHFALRLDGAMLLGQISSSDLGPRPRRLIRVGEMMREYCESRRESIIAEGDMLIKH